MTPCSILPFSSPWCFKFAPIYFILFLVYVCRSFACVNVCADVHCGAWPYKTLTWEIPYRAIPGMTRSPRKRMQGTGIVKHPPGYCTQPTPLYYHFSRDSALSPSGLPQKQGSYPPWVFISSRCLQLHEKLIFSAHLSVSWVLVRNLERCKEDFPPQGVRRAHL